MWKELCFVFIVIIIGIRSVANDYSFSHLTTADGISQSEVYAFHEDHNGFVWIGTLHGLNRYDGYSFEIFNTDKTNPNSLNNNTIRSLAEDNNGRIWIGTDNGLNYYDQRKELIYKINLVNTKEKLVVGDLLVYNDNILVGTNDGLWIGSVKNLEIELIEKSFCKFDKNGIFNSSDNFIRSLITSNRGGVLVMTTQSIIRLDFKNGTTNPTIIEEFPLHNIESKRKMVEDNSGCLWILSYEYGIFRFNPEKNVIRNITLENDFLKNFSKKYSKISIGKDQKIWVGTNDNGLLCITYDSNKEVIKNVESIQNDRSNLTGLNSNLISSIYSSNKNIIWVGTIGSGVNVLDSHCKKFQHYNLKPQSNILSNINFVRTVLVDKQNRIIVGTHRNGLYLFDRITNQTVKLGFETQSIFHISEYVDNKYFICSDNGLYLVEINDLSFKVLSKGEEVNSSSFYVTHSQNNIFWCATYNGLVRFHIENNKILVDGEISKSTQPSISSDICRVVHFDSIINQLLVGTESGGLNVIKLDSNSKPTAVKTYKMEQSDNSLSSDHIRSIVQNRNNVFWIGTFEGLNKCTLNPVTGEFTFKAFNKKNGLPNNLISSIVEDDNKNLWIGTSAGLTKFSLNGEHFINYSIDDGLQNNEFSEHAVNKTKTGELVFGGTNGINAFYPNDITINNFKPNTLITDFYLNNQRVMSGQVINGYVPLKNSILYTELLELSPKHKNVGFKFSAMIYPNAGKIKYAYMLEGFDKEWRYTDANNRNINYNNLQHGNYIFKVKATNTDGVWNEKPTSLSIYIKTPFYLTWFAILVYFAIFILLFIYFSHYTVINLTTKRNLLLDKEHSEKLHNLDEMRTRFFINISHDLRTPLTLISGPLNNILANKSVAGEFKENLQLIKRNVKRLTDMVEQLLDFRKAESVNLTPKLESVDFVAFSENEISHFLYAAKTKGLVLSVESAEKKIVAAIDPCIIAKVYFNALSNAITFTSSGSIKIKIQRVNKEIPGLLPAISNHRYIQVEIIDTGIGITKEQEKLIFDRFYQGNTKQGNGYGIGLSHTKDLIEGHQGLVEAESNPNGGTIIRFFIPDKLLENTTITNDAINNNKVYIIEDAIKEQVNEGVPNLGFKNILVVDDNIDMLKYIRNGLKNNYNVFTANNGADGLTVACNNMPDLIVSDVMMPEMDGIEFCKAIKTNIVTSHIPVILLTAKAELETKYKGIETGADDYILKPFEMEYLLIRINNSLQLRENLRKIYQKSLVLEPSDVTVTSVDEKFLKRLMDAIEENMSDEEFSINSLAPQLGLSLSTFYRKIKTLTGQSGNELLIHVRLKRAHQILSEKKGIRVSEVSFMVGFSSHRYFTKCFKEFFGYPPSGIGGS